MRSLSSVSLALVFLSFFPFFFFNLAVSRAKKRSERASFLPPRATRTNLFSLVLDRGSFFSFLFEKGPEQKVFCSLLQSARSSFLVPMTQ